MRLRFAALSFVFSLAMSGCVPADSVFYVQGKLVDQKQEPYSQCNVRLLDRSKAIIDDAPMQWAHSKFENGRTRIDPQPGSNFLTLFILPPLGISCDGSDKTVETAIHTNETTFRKPFDIGLIVLPRA